MAREYQAFMDSASEGCIFRTITQAREWAEEFGTTANDCHIYDRSGHLVAHHRRDSNGDGTRWFKAYTGGGGLTQMPNLTADDLRQWADYMDNPGEVERPDGVNPADVEVYRKRRTIKRPALNALMAERDRLRDVLTELLNVTQHPDNGVHYCRWCGNQHTSEGHDPHCAYTNLCYRIDEARTNARAALEHP